MDSREAMVDDSAGRGALVEVISLEQYAAMAAEVDELLSNSNFPNCFYHPSILCEALRHFSRGQSVKILTARAGAGGALRGVCAVGERHKFRSIPLKHFGLLDYEHCYATSPLLSRNEEREVLASLLHFLEEQYSTPLVGFPEIGAELATILETLPDAAKRSYFRTDQISKSECRSIFSTEDYLMRVLSGKARKEFRRKLKKISAEYEFRFHALPLEADLKPWWEKFLALERKGWKSELGQPIASSDQDSLFFYSLLEAAHERGDAVCVSIEIDEKPIAMRFGVIAGGRLFSLKTAYDESFSAFSPGTLLEVLHIDHLHSRGGVDVVDSCADPNSELFRRLFAERYEVCTLFVSSSGGFGRVFLKCFKFLRNLRSRRGENS